MRIILSAACFLLLGACYIEGQNCSGQYCYGVSTQGYESNYYFHGEYGHIEYEQQRSRYQCPDADEVQSDALSTLNRARRNSAEYGCGGGNTVLVWSETAFSVSDRHSRDMAANNFIGKTGSDGLSPITRLRDADDAVIATELLVAGGFYTTGELISQWLASSSECSQLFNDQFTEFALACRDDNDTDYNTYWTLLLSGKSLD